MIGPGDRRVAGAPISWGVCEVPGWGHQMARDRVLAEMRDLGLTATEYGPDGFLPSDPQARSALLDAYGLRPAGGFVPVVLHDPAHDPLPDVDRALDSFGALRGVVPTADGQDVPYHQSVLVLAAATGGDGYDERPVLDATAWATLLAGLDRIVACAATRGVLAVLHPHVGTMVEGPEEIDRVLRGSSISLCLDTGHLLIGGADPLRLSRETADRIAHVHLKDVDARLAERVRTGELTYTEAVRLGVYRPLGAGDVDIAGIIEALEGSGYRGWYVLEQDTILSEPPPVDGGPVGDVRTSLAFLTGVGT